LKKNLTVNLLLPRRRRRKIRKKRTKLMGAQKLMLTATQKNHL
jgi:hypothetical protein